MNTNRLYRHRGFTLIELIICIAILAILASLVIGAGAAIGGCSTSQGNRVGYVTKFSYKGAVHKSWEGELALGGARSSQNGVVANIWPFSVDSSNEKAIQALDALQDNGHRAKLKYSQVLMHNPFSHDTSYYVTEVTDLEATNAVPEKPTNK